MQHRPSPNFQSFLFHAELARIQVTRFKRVARDFDLLVKSAALNFAIASLGAVPWERPSSQSGESGRQSMDRGKQDAPARNNPEPFDGAQRQRIMDALRTLSSRLSRLPSEDEAIARMRRSVLTMEALLSVKH